jgi:hypothetical protein
MLSTNNMRIFITLVMVYFACPCLRCRERTWRQCNRRRIAESSLPILCIHYVYCASMKKCNFGKVNNWKLEKRLFKPRIDSSNHVIPIAWTFTAFQKVRMRDCKVQITFTSLTAISKRIIKKTVSRD